MKRAFEERLKNQPEQKNNNLLPAGSPMYFYCKYCGHLSDTLPENYVTPPTKVCKDCREMVKAGLL